MKIGSLIKLTDKVSSISITGLITYADSDDVNIVVCSSSSNWIRGEIHLTKMNRKLYWVDRDYKYLPDYDLLFSYKIIS